MEEREKIGFKIVELNWVVIKELNVLNEKMSGVYQIYGDSPIYGTNTLLYIGKSDCLKNRLLEHDDNKESHIRRQPNISYRYAEVTPEILHIVESTLIVMNKPSFNSSSIAHINSFSREEAIYIQNHYERGILPLEQTNYYFIKKNKN